MTDGFLLAFIVTPMIVIALAFVALFWQKRETRKFREAVARYRARHGASDGSTASSAP